MLTIAVCIALSEQVSQQGTKVYRDPAMGLTFQRPANWEFKKNKYGEQFEFSVADGSFAVVQIFKTKFRQTTETWQDLQSQVATQMNRKVTKQWEEQILGVPLLMTRIEYSENSTEKATIVGLLYSSTQEKLNFRINSSFATIDEAENSWRQALLSLRTLSGELPKKDDPTKPLIKADVNEKGQRIVRYREEDIKPTAKPANGATIFALGRKVAVVLPKGWTIEQSGDEAILKSPSFSTPIVLTIIPGGAPHAETAISESNSQSISGFHVVSLREESGWKRNKVGAQTISSMRTGKVSHGKTLSVLILAGTYEGLVWHYQYSNTDEKQFKSDKKLLDDLIQNLNLEFEA